jgi:hypothetical protein
MQTLEGILEKLKNAPVTGSAHLSLNEAQVAHAALLVEQRLVAEMNVNLDHQKYHNLLSALAHFVRMNGGLQAHSNLNAFLTGYAGCNWTEAKAGAVS